MDQSARDLIKQGEHLFSKKSRLHTLWQEIADNFYPEREGFTVTRDLGEEFASHLMTSLPLLARRDLGSSFASMLRRDKWFKLTVEEGRDDIASRQWLEWATGVQYRAMYDRRSQFVRATKEGDHDFAAFGQCAISVEKNLQGNGLLYRCWHLKDMAWCENAEGKIDTVHRKWKPTARDLKSLFGDKVHTKVNQKLEKEPYCEIECRHIVIPADSYNEKKYRTPYISFYIDVENEHVMQEVGLHYPMYVIPRWQTVSGSQYAYSPATIVALPESRLIQAMTLVLLEAGEKAVNPPMIAAQGAMRSEVSIYAGGINWVDNEEIRSVSDFLQPMQFDKSGIPTGMNMRDDVNIIIREAFYLNKLTLPIAGDMTAYEVSQRVQEYIRQALPLFEPMEAEYNGAICEMTFDLMLRAGAFGAVQNIPDTLQGADVQFKFESPLNEAIDRQKGQKFMEAKGLLVQAAEIDPSIIENMDIQEAFRDALQGIGTPAKWMRDERLVAQLQAEKRAQMEKQQQMMELGDAAQVAEQVGTAEQALSGAA